MAFRTNYRFQRTERDRAKQTKKEEKLKRRQDREATFDAPEDADEQRPESDAAMR